MSEVELTISAGQPQPPGSFRLIATLTLAGMIAGLALASAFQFTKPTIDANRARELRLGVFKVVPGSSAMQKLVLRDGELLPVTDDEQRAEPTIYGAYDQDGRFLGYAIVGEGPGYQDTIRLLYGYDPAARQVIGMHVLLSRETPGLGDKIYKDADFQANFEALAVEPAIVLVKDGRSAANEVDAITGATISSKAVVKIINAANERWLAVLPTPERVPPLPEPSDRDISDTRDGEGD